MKFQNVMCSLKFFRPKTNSAILTFKSTGNVSHISYMSIQLKLSLVFVVNLNN